MNKMQMIGVVSEKTSLSKAHVKIILESILLAITETLKSGETVQLVGFGTFKINKRNACIGRNPQTGATIHISSVKIPVFISGKSFKNIIKDPEKTGS